MTNEEILDKFKSKIVEVVKEFDSFLKKYEEIQDKFRDETKEMLNKNGFNQFYDNYIQTMPEEEKNYYYSFALKTSVIGNLIADYIYTLQCLEGKQDIVPNTPNTNTIN